MADALAAPLSLAERVQQLASEAPTAPALQCGTTRQNRAEVCRAMNGFANALIERGAQRGDTVGVLTGHNTRWPSCHLGALAAGLCVVPISTMLPAETTARIAQDAQLQFLVASASQRALAEEMLKADARIAPRARFALDFEADGWHSLEATLATGANTFTVRPRATDDPVEIIYSSGTTGLPKGIVMGHEARTRAYLVYASAGMDETSVALCSTPPYSNPSIGLTFGTLYSGGRVIFLPKFDALEFLKIAAAERVTHLFLVPTQLARLLEHPRFGEFDLSATRCKLLGGSTLQIETKRAALARWPGMLIETYGMTEGGPATMLRVEQHPDKVGSVGQAPPGVTLKVIDSNDNEVPPGTVGEIVGRSNFMMLGYHGRPQDSAQVVWRDASGERFLRSGDLGRIDDEGFLYLSGRAKDLIISGGFNVYPADIEAVLSTHPAVQECAVIGIPSERWGEAPLAIVEKRAAEPATAPEILEWANARLGRHQRIAKLEFTSELPRGPMGKVLKRELQADYARRPAAARA